MPGTRGTSEALPQLSPGPGAAELESTTRHDDDIHDLNPRCDTRKYIYI
jgi:hypothetical protein